jgi:hypothetical protein
MNEVHLHFKFIEALDYIIQVHIILGSAAHKRLCQNYKSLFSINMRAAKCCYHWLHSYRVSPAPGYLRTDWPIITCFVCRVGIGQTTRQKG